MLQQASRDNDPDNDTEFARIAELEKQLAAAQAELAALREPVAGLRLTPDEVLDRLNKRHNASQYGIFEMAETFGNNLLAAMEIIAQQREQLASRDDWVRTADRLPDFGALSEITLLVWRPLMIHPITLTIPAGSKALSNYTHWRALPAPPAGDEGGDDA